jgi:hypothetical protein
MKKGIEKRGQRKENERMRKGEGEKILKKGKKKRKERLKIEREKIG